MLPILRVLPVGGVLLAIVLLILALNPPDGSRARLRPPALQARGALIERNEHPEWPQFLLLAAIRRADELIRLRSLPDAPVHADVKPDTAKTIPQEAPQAALAPAAPVEVNPDDDLTGSISQAPAATMPIDIGETSSTELPVGVREEEKPPVIMTPQRIAPRHESRIRRTRRVAREAATPDTTAPANFFQALMSPQYPAAGTAAPRR